MHFKNKNIMTREQIIKHWDVIQAFKEGKTIQYYDEVDKCWYIAYVPSFRLDVKFRIKPEEKLEQKRIIELSDDGETWFEATRFIPKCEKLHARVRVEKQPIKRLPTIEEVEKWFLENKVFVYTPTKTLCRIQELDPSAITQIYSRGCMESIEIFCNLYTNLDGSELYITEN